MHWARVVHKLSVCLGVYCGFCSLPLNVVITIFLYTCTMHVLFIVCSADQSKQRREVVRRKTAEYLKHAEELYQKHLAPSSNDGEKEKVHTCTMYINVHVHTRFRVSLSASGSASLFFPPSFPFSSSSHDPNLFVSSSTAHTFGAIILRPIRSLCPG